MNNFRLRIFVCCLVILSLFVSSCGQKGEESLRFVKVERGNIMVKYCPTDSMIGGFISKPL